MEYAPAETYEKVDPEKLLTLGARHAWIDVDIHPKFDIHGNLVPSTSLAG